MSDIETRQKKLPVLLFIRGEQYFDDVDPDATELTTEGTLELTEEGLLLTYQETALTGMEGTTTTFEVSGPQVILRRVGSVNSQMVFEEGRQHTSLYETPYGELSVDIQTSALRHNLSERGGLLEIKYSIAVEHTVTGRNSFKIRVKRKYDSVPANRAAARPSILEEPKSLAEGEFISPGDSEKRGPPGSVPWEAHGDREKQL